MIGLDDEDLHSCSPGGPPDLTSVVPAARLNPTRCLAGLDEAGLGPILGPLVVAGVALDGPEGIDPWDALREAVARKRPSGRQVQVADSKKVHQGPHALARLERTALSFWSAWRGAAPSTLGALLEDAGTDLDVLSTCPWYADLSLPLPLENEAADLELRTHLLRQTLDRTGIALRHIAVAPLEVAEFNASIRSTGNKSETHFLAYARVLTELLQHAPAGAHVVADRCGGRVHYRAKLTKTFPGTRVATLREAQAASSYRITRPDGAVQVTFASGGEERAFPTALASCLAKYVREAMLRALNRWFAERVPGLRPTAGYYVDGHRFLEDVAAVVDGPGFDRSSLVRVR